MDEAKVQDAGEIDARRVSPWLLTTGWHLHISGYDHKELSALVRMPKLDEFSTLAMTVVGYFRECYSYIDVTDDLELQYLNSPDPTKQ